MKKVLGAAVAALIIAASVVYVASAASHHAAKRSPSSSAGSSIRTLNLACAARLYGVQGMMVYVNRARQCKASRGETLVRLKTQSVYVCRKEHGGFSARRNQSRVHARRGSHSYGPAGLIRLVDDPSKCAPETQPNETAHKLPRKADTYFCVDRRSKELLWRSRRTKCTRKEFKVVLKGRDDGTPQPPLNRAPVAADDSTSTNEGSSKQVSVLSNDTDADGDAISISSVDTTGTKGQVAQNPDGTFSYDPNGQFEALKAGQSATDSFTYKAKDAPGADSNPAKVTITVSGTNDAPVANDDSATTDDATATQIDVLANDTDAENQSLKVGSVDTTGTKGAVTITGGGADVQYDPNGQFTALAPGDTDTDTFKYKANDGSADSVLAATVTVTITGGDDAPVVTTSSGDTAYTENDPGAAIDGTLTVTDADNPNLESAVVRISAGLDAQDFLDFTDQNGITGSYDNGTGVLTLTGTASKSDYEAALRSVKFSSNSDNPATSKSVEFKVNDGTKDSAAATKSISVTRVNDAPAVEAGTGSASYTEGSSAAQVSPAFTVTDPDDTDLESAKVEITSNFSSSDGDTLNFTNQSGISGVYNSGTGVLTLTGTASKADYETAIRSITFSNTSDNPSTATRTVSFTVNDGAADSNTDTRDVTVSAANDAPVVTTSSGSTSYTEGDPSTTIDGSLTVTDADDTDLESARVRISSGFESGDDLVFVNTANISGVYNTGTGVLELTGTDTVANYQAALRSIKYRHTGDNPATSKTVEFKANDTDATPANSNSNAATKNLSITRVNDAPTLTTTAAALSYTEGDGAVAVDSGLTLSDPDSTQVQGATVQITSNFVQADDQLAFTNTASITGSYNDTTGTLTLSGTDTLANYQSALRSVAFENVNDNPSGTKTVSFQATDAESAPSNVATRDINLSNANDAPVVTTSSGSTSYTEGDPATTIDGSLTVTDADDTNLEGAQVRISSNFESGDDLVFVNQNGISGVYNTGTGVLTLTGTSSVANYQTAFRSIQYQHTGDNPSTGKVVEFKANDGDSDSNAATKTINITGVNDGPTITTTAAALSYTEGNGAVAVDSGLTVDDPENNQITGATVQITSNFNSGEDDLVFVDAPPISGSYNSATGTLTLSGTASESSYQAALRSVQYRNNSDDPTNTTRTVSFQTTGDDGSPSQPSNVSTRDISVADTNDAPVVTTSAGSTGYTEDGAAVAVDGGIGGITVSDADDTNLEGGQVRISSGFQSGDDLVFVNQNGISGVYNTGTGVLTLSGTSSVANYQTALRSIQFQTTNGAPVASKTVEFKVNDGDADSNAATKEITVTPSNDAPTLNTSGGNAAFTEDGSGPVQADPALTLTDPDSTNIQGATVEITTGFNSGEDQLVFVDTANITGAYNSGTGVLTLSGTDTVANYQDALRSVQYNNTDTVAPDTTTRTVRFQATDAEGAPSNLATRDVTVSSVNDAPVVTPTSGSTAYTEGDPATTIDGGITVSDQDDTNLEGGQVRISSGFQSGDDLVFVNQNGISGVYNTGTGVLTLSGTSSVANYQTALQSIQYQSTNNNPVTSKTVEFKVGDGDADSNAPTKEIAVTPVNSPPGVGTTSANLGYTENDPATAVDSGLTVSDPESNDLSGGSSSITANYQAGQDFLAWTDNNLADNITQDNINTTAQTVVLTGIDTAANYQAALRAVTYQNNSENPSALTRTVTFSATDTPGGATGSNTRGIAVTSVDDPPDAMNDTATVLEDAAATAIPVLTNDTDIDGGPKTISSATDPANGTVVLTGGSPGAHTGLTYQPDPNYCNDPPGTTPDTFQYTVNGGDTATVSMTVTCVNDAPVADDETFNGNDSAIGNTTLQVDDPSDDKPAPTNPNTEITGDILAGDTDVDGPGPLTVTAGTFATKKPADDTNDGGSVTIEADGDFRFEPPSGCSASSSYFDYTVEDSDPSDEKTDTGRVTISIAGCVWYVKNDGPGGTGTSSNPFDTTALAEAASNVNNTIFVYDGNNTSNKYDTGFQLKAGQRLIGEHEGLVVDPDENRQANTNGALTADTLWPANPGAFPTLTATNEDVVALDDNNEVRGFNLDPDGAGGGIAGASGDTGGGTIDDVNIVDSNATPGTQPGLELDSTTGTFNVSNLVVNNKATGVKLHNTTTNTNDVSAVFDPASQISITSSGGAGLDVDGTAAHPVNLGTSTFDDITVTGSNAGGVNITNATGTKNLGDGSGTDLSLTTTSGATPAFELNSAGTTTVDSSGSDDVHATGGPAIDVTGTSGQTLAFDDVDSTNSANDGINIDGLGTGTFTAASGDLGGASGITFDLNGGSGKVDYPGNINNGSGTTAIEITGRSGGTGVNGVTLSGPISDTNDLGGTINLIGNTGGTTTLSNATKQVDTRGPANNGTADGVIFNSSDGHTLNLTGGLDIDTISGKGLEASTSGTLEVSGGVNTIDTTTGRALNVSDTDISSNDLTFQRISSNGASDGIRLNNTANSAGKLSVTGTGSAGSGGSILNSTDAGVLLNSVPGGVDLTRMNVVDSVDDGIRGTSVANGLNLNNMSITSNGTDLNAPGGGVHGDHGVDMTNITGTSTFTSNTISNNQDANVVFDNSSGTSNLNVTGGAYSGATGGVGTGIEVTSPDNATGSNNLNVQGPITFATNKGDAVYHNTGSHNTTDNDVIVNNATVTSPASGGGPDCGLISGVSHVLGGGITASEGGATSGGGSNTDVTFTNNNIQNSCIGGITVGTGGSVSNQEIANVDATISGNTIGTTGVAGSGSTQGNGIFIDSNGNSNVRVLITNNTVRQWTNRSGLDLDVIDGDAAMDATVKNNVFTEPNSAFSGTTTRGMTMQLGTAQAGDSVDVCLDIGDPANAALKNQVFGTGESPQPDVRYLQENGGGAQIKLVGYAGSTSPTITDIANWFQPRNNLGGTPTVTGTGSTPGSTTTGAASCAQPAP